MGFGDPACPYDTNIITLQDAHQLKLNVGKINQKSKSFSKNIFITFKQNIRSP